MITGEKKAKIITDLRASDNDTGSAEVQVGLATARIAELTDHLKKHKQDHAARRNLLQLVGQRKRHLKYISNRDTKDYLELIKKLGIRR